MEKGGVIINYHNITYPDMNNGDGLRVVLWLSGCEHHCKECQNPQTWDINSGILFDEKAREELFRELDKNYISGLTFSGGDPLNESNLDDVLEIIKEFKTRYKNKTIWLYTGFTWEECQPFNKNSVLKGDEFAANLQKILKKRQHIISQCDVIVDGKYDKWQRDVTLKWRGSKNQRVINVKDSLKNNEIILYCD